MTASTVTETLSLVMTFCGSTLITRSRMSTLIRSSITGTRKVRPESTVERYFPSRMTIPFSYWATTRAERASATRKMNRTMTSSSSSTWEIIESPPHQQGHTVESVDRHLGARLDRHRGSRRGQRAPHLVPHPHLARVMRVDPLGHQSRTPEHRVDVRRRVPDLEARAHPAAPGQDVERAQPARHQQAEPRVVSPLADCTPDHERAADQDQVEPGEPAERDLDQDQQGAADDQHP